MSDLFGNHIVGFPTRWLIFCFQIVKIQFLSSYAVYWLSVYGVVTASDSPGNLDIHFKNRGRKN